MQKGFCGADFSHNRCKSLPCRRLHPSRHAIQPTGRTVIARPWCIILSTYATQKRGVLRMVESVGPHGLMVLWKLIGLDTATPAENKSLRTILAARLVCNSGIGSLVWRTRVAGIIHHRDFSITEGWNRGWGKSRRFIHQIPRSLAFMVN